MDTNFQYVLLFYLYNYRQVKLASLAEDNTECVDSLDWMSA